MTFREFAESLPRVIDALYITADKVSIKLWKEKPKWNETGHYWAGSASVGHLDMLDKVNFSEYRGDKLRVDYSKCILELS